MISVLYWAHFAWNVPLEPLIFLKRSLVFTILLFSSISLHWVLRSAFLPFVSILWISAFKWVCLSFSLLLFASLLFTAACKAKLELFFTFLYDTDRLIFNCLYRASLDAQMVKNLPAVQETWVRYLGQEGPLKKEMATNSSILAWRIPWIEQPARLYIIHGVTNSQTQLSS